MLMLGCGTSSIKTYGPSYNETLSANATQVTSLIWGDHGEKRDRIKLPDFTEAGYRKGRVPFPTYSTQINVKQMGAIGDGIADDSNVFIAALKKCKDRKTIYIPPGIFKISQILSVEQDQCLIKGAGPTKTTLLFEKGLEELFPIYTNGQTRWSWSGALIVFDRVKESGIEDLTVEVRT